MKLKNHIVKNKEILWIRTIYTNYRTQKKKKKLEPPNGQIWKPDPEPSLNTIILDLYTQMGGSKAKPLSTSY